MSDAKIELSIAGLSFKGEGSMDWLEKQLDKMIEASKQLSSVREDIRPKENSDDFSSMQPQSSTIASNDGDAKPVPSLGIFLKSHDASNSDLKKCLATAVWLSHRGVKKFTMKIITKALADAHQSKFSNSTVALKRTVKKGFFEADGTEYYVTPEGFAGLGVEADK